MKYFVRYIKVMRTSNKKNYPLSKLLFCYTGDEYEPIKNIGTYNGDTANECVKTYSHCLYKYTDKFIQTDNVIITNDFEEFKNKLKYEYGITMLGNTIYQTILPYNLSIYEKNIPPDPFNFFDKRNSNKYEIETDYPKSKTRKHEIYVGLYKYNEITKEYDFLPESMYDNKKKIYYLYQKI
jgi:hypothetical protein